MCGFYTSGVFWLLLALCVDLQCCMMIFNVLRMGSAAPHSSWSPVVNSWIQFWLLFAFRILPTLIVSELEQVIGLSFSVLSVCVLGTTSTHGCDF